MIIVTIVITTTIFVRMLITTLIIGAVMVVNLFMITTIVLCLTVNLIAILDGHHYLLVFTEVIIWNLVALN